MSTSLPLSIATEVKEERTCDEHRCILLRNSDIWKRFDRGKLRLKEPYTKRRKNPTPDRKGRIAPWNQDISLVDDSYAPGHQRHIVLEAHCFRLADGKVGGASALVDPKEILIGDTLYVRLEYEVPRCALCEGGDMVPFEMRFENSRYKPGTTVIHRGNRVPQDPEIL
jgi:hypothetical protein